MTAEAFDVEGEALEVATQLCAIGWRAPSGDGAVVAAPIIDLARCAFAAGAESERVRAGTRCGTLCENGLRCLKPIWHKGRHDPWWDAALGEKP